MSTSIAVFNVETSMAVGMITNSMLVGTRQKLGDLLPLRICLNNTAIEAGVSYSYLGVIVDCERSWVQSQENPENP